MTADTEAASTEIVRHVPVAAPVEEYRPRILLAPDDAKALDEALRAGMRAVLREDVDYGVIPGTKGKPTLLKPGAEKLLQWFGYGHSNMRDEIERDGDGARVGVTYKCTVFKTLTDGREITVAACDGYAGYDEDRFFTSLAQAEAKERANAEKYHRAVNPSKLVEYRAPWNSVIKMAQKRALVGATLQATSASSLFTQDMEDQAAAENATALATVADAVIREFPVDVLQELDKWYSSQGWPQPGSWSTEQFCRALVAVGRLDALAGPEQPKADAVAEAAGQGTSGYDSNDPWLTAAPSEPERSWHDRALEESATFATADAGRKLWRENAAAYKAGDCTQAERVIIEQRITARQQDLGKDETVLTGTLVENLDAASPWAAKVEGITTADEADEALAELEEVARGGRLNGREVKDIRAAIKIKALGFRQAAA